MNDALKSKNIKTGENEILVKSIYYPDGVAVEKTKIIKFVKPILGFGSFRNYCILNIDRSKNLPFFILQSIENEKLCFIMTDPNYFFKDYSVNITSEEKDILGIADKTDAIIFVIVTIFKDLYSSTVNLKGPVVINTRNNKAMQTVINSDFYPAKQKLPIAMPDASSQV